MSLFSKLFEKKEEKVTQPEFQVEDSDIVAMADGEMMDVRKVSDPLFAQEVMGKSVAFRYHEKKVILHAPANGTIAAIYPTGHAFGITTNVHTQLLVHCGIDTVQTNGDGFVILDKKEGDPVKAGDPIVAVDIEKLSKNYDMTTMLIVTNNNGEDISFIESKNVIRGESLIVKK